MALPRVPVATTADPKTRPLIRFDAQRELLDRARARMRRSYSVTGAYGLSIGIAVDAGAIESAPKRIQTEIRKLLRNAATTLQDRAQQINRRMGYDTGLMASAWKGRVAGELKDFSIQLTNTTPYAGVAKRAGSDWREGKTIVRTYIEPMVQAAAKEFGRELSRLIKRTLERA